MKSAIRPWCGVIVYPDLKPVLFGHITMPSTASYWEIEYAMLTEARKHLPPGFKITNLQCGALVFHEEEL